ncbi:transcriptional regulator [Sporosarcina sp. NCCP-2222]|uniref:helix-turn-helix domain-containing protein n=1 Tax=Sporosarcina sp. NCCP-2222 TaxID=2935073 RepID=UPI00208D3261|nr:helix-turn-helix transcriptional regulator [Sporosarcina sp. NCCP-2222]GKV54277.1 transcriptional regulator [Sporosarcina sp. NCCP-2222]
MTENVLGKRMKSLRERRNLKQNVVSEKLGVSPYQLSRYESGKTKPDPEMIASIAKYYDVTTDYLLGASNTPRPIVVAGQEINLTSEELELFNELKKHPIMLHDLASDPERKVKELIKLYKMKKMFLEDDDEDLGDGFGTLKD